MRSIHTYGFALLMAMVMISCNNDAANQNESGEAVLTEAETSASAAGEPKVAGQEVTYMTDTTKMHGYLAFDESTEGKRPGVLVVHEWWGHNDYARQRADMLAELGYVALAVDMYGGGQQADHPDDAGKFAMSVMGDFPTAEARFRAAVDKLKEDPRVDPESIAAIGYCFGGSVVLSMANTGMEELDAVVSFHGGVGLPVMPEAGKVKARVLVCNGADDPFVTAEQISTYTTAMDAAGANYEFINYEGAKHSFTSKEADANGEKFNLPLAYNQAADEQSWAAMTALFGEVFQKD